MKVTNMPKTGQFVAVWATNKNNPEQQKLWSSTFKWNEAQEILQEYNETIDDFAGPDVRTVYRQTMDHMVFISLEGQHDDE